MFYKDERLALFIDGSNLYAAAKALGFDIDYKLLRQEFMRRGQTATGFLLHPRYWKMTNIPRSAHWWTGCITMVLPW